MVLSRPAGTAALLAVATLTVDFASDRLASHRAAIIPEMPEAPASADVTSGGGKAGLPARRPEVYFAAIAERPLFAPSRRPLDAEVLAEPTPEVAPAPAPEVEVYVRPEIALLGTMNAADGWLALIRIGDAPASWLPLGAPVTDLTITAIGPTSVALASDSTDLELGLYPK